MEVLGVLPIFLKSTKPRNFTSVIRDSKLLRAEIDNTGQRITTTQMTAWLGMLSVAEYVLLLSQIRSISMDTLPAVITDSIPCLALSSRSSVAD
jgi:hypothetical protein